MALDDLAKIKLAMAWLDPDRARRVFEATDSDQTAAWPKPQSDLLPLYNELLRAGGSRASKSTNASRLIKPLLLEAFARGLVDLVPARAPGLAYRWGGGELADPAGFPGYDENLTKLARKFEKLYEPFGFIGKVSVVDPPATGGAQPDVHQYLGHACAREIHVRDIFKRFVSEKTTRIAWGSGRGTYFTQEALFRYFPQVETEDRRELDLVSLTGNLFNGKIANNQYLDDADIVAALSARVFAREVINLQKTNSPLAVAKDQREDLLNRTWLGNRLDHQNLEKNRLSVAIFGIGVLESGSGHRLITELENYRAGGQPQQPGGITSGAPAEFFEKLNALVEISEKARRQIGHSILGDICNRLIFISPRPGHSGKCKLDTTKIIEKINSVNEYLVTVKKRQLRHTLGGMNIIVAGGVEKAAAIHSVLTTDYMKEDGEPFNLPTKLLVTDAKTLRLLIDYGNARARSETGIG